VLPVVEIVELFRLRVPPPVTVTPERSVELAV
jgi:hypothetical protein